MTMLAKPLRTIGIFATADANELSRQLTLLEQNADDAIRSLSKAAEPVLQPTNLKVSAYVASLDELVRVDTSVASLVVTLPVATPQNSGRGLAIARVSASNTLTVAPVSGKVNGAASLALTAAVRLFWLVSDGAAWWSTA